ncbi:hypothetical protein B0H65DRAFT_30413 [Neurospora tetraspora]|uniref:Uncharacterized protein n=1 Tax=Neurospora tetraspora TaxID=94610 RepID=A0AAE0MWL3_9PEZI|nr:hypothetical protein B0H65DRAFT_30413 [Neurospora tetraspora]
MRAKAVFESQSSQGWGFSCVPYYKCSIFRLSCLPTDTSFQLGPRENYSILCTSQPSVPTHTRWQRRQHSHRRRTQFIHGGRGDLHVACGGQRGFETCLCDEAFAFGVGPFRFLTSIGMKGFCGDVPLVLGVVKESKGFPPTAHRTRPNSHRHLTAA